jgi:uncharacterized protein YqeY
MTLIEKIKIDQVAARKARYVIETNLLTTLIGEAEMVGKNDGNRAPTDGEVVATVRKFQKNAYETLALVNANADARAEVQFEIDILSRYLPTQITGDKLKSVIESIVIEIGATPKDMGKIMGLLKSRFDGQYDGKEASTIVRSVLA